MRIHFNRLVMTLCVAACFGLAAGGASAADPGASDEELIQVGSAIKTTRLVHGHIGGEVRNIPLMGEVYHDEMIETGA